MRRSSPARSHLRHAFPSTGTASSPRPSSSSRPRVSPGLTMRRLGERLGVEAMSLYRYVPGKEDLLDAVVESLVRKMAGTARCSRPRATGGRTSCSGWPTAYDEWRWSTRRPSRSSPPGPPEAPWLRPPLRSIHWVETFLDGADLGGLLRRRGRRWATARSPASCSGHLLLEVANLGADVGPLDVIDDGSPDYDGPRGLSRTYAACARPSPRTTRPSSSRSRWRTCSSGWP